MNFRQNFSQKKITFAISEKNFSRDCSLEPKGLRKGNPFQGPFAQLSYIYTSKKQIQIPALFGLSTSNSDLIHL